MSLGHVIQHFLRVLESLYELFVLGLHNFVDQIVKSLMVFVVVNDSFGCGVDDDLRLVDKNHLNCLVAHAKDDCMLRPEPSFNVDQVSRI